MKSIKDEEISLEEFSEKYCDGLYCSKLELQEQCDGYLVLKKMVDNDIVPDWRNMASFHPNLRVKLCLYWHKIKLLKSAFPPIDSPSLAHVKNYYS